MAITYKCYDIIPCPDDPEVYDIFLFGNWIGWGFTIKQCKIMIRHWQMGGY